MPITKFQLLLLCAILLNCAILFYISHTQTTSEEPNGQGKPLLQKTASNREESIVKDTNYFHNIKHFESEVTVVIMEFEDFENDIPRSIQSITKIFSKISIIIISSRRPYPPLAFSSVNVKLVIEQVSPDQKQSSGRPENYITTPYVLVIPDGARFDSAKLPMLMLETLKKSSANHKIVAVPVESRSPSNCQGLKVDLKRWTLQYSVHRNLSGEYVTCDSVSNTPAVILKSAFLHSLSAPYIRPFPDSLFVQASIHFIHTILLYKHSLSRGTELFTNPHNQWKHEQAAKKRLQNMYKRFGIKKVELSNGHHEWHGCSKNTKRCFGTIIDDMPEFLYENRWTPPCCLKNLRETANYVFKVLEKSKVKYWLEGGSLLGAARYNDIIPWDYDVDVGIYRNEISKCEFLAKAEEMGRSGSKFVDDQGFVWEKMQDMEFYKVHFSQFNHMHVDIFPFYERNGIMTKNHWFKTHRQDTEFPAKYLKPLTKIRFIGMQVSAPNNVKEFLEYKFGRGVIENPQYPNPSKVKRKPKETQDKRNAL